MRVSRFLSVALLVTAACGGATQDGDSPAAPAVTLDARHGETFRLRPGQTARVSGTGLLIGFRAITADSRCPRDVECVWQGDAVARIRISAEDGDYASFDLHTALEPKAVEFAGRIITLVSVAPIPDSRAPIDPASYTITLRVD